MCRESSRNAIEFLKFLRCQRALVQIAALEVSVDGFDANYLRHLKELDVVCTHIEIALDALGGTLLFQIRRVIWSSMTPAWQNGSSSRA